MANDKQFIAKNGFLTSNAESNFTSSTQATPTATFTNSGGAGPSSLPGSGAVIAKFVGDSDAMVITNISQGDYFFGNNQQNNGINFYDGTGGMEFYYNGVEKFSIDTNGTTFTTGHTTNGTTTTNRLKVEDNGSTSPLVVIKADDQGPWALTVGNDTYSTTELMGHMFYQSNSGETYYDSRGNGVYEDWYFRQNNGTTARYAMTITSAGNVGINTTTTAYGKFQVNQSTNNDVSGIGILDSTSARTMRLWVDSNDSYISSASGGTATLQLNKGGGLVLISKGSTADYTANQTGVVKKTFQVHDTYDTAGTHWVAYANLDGNWQDSTSGADSQHGWIFGHSNNVRGGLIYDHRGIERMAMWSSYGKMDFLIANAADGNGVPIDSNIVEAMTIIPGGNVGIGTTVPGSKLHIESTIVNEGSPDFPVTIAQVDYSNTVNQSGGSGVGIRFNPATNSADAVGGAIAAINTSATDDDTTTALAFYTSDNDTTLDEKMRISPNGVVDFYGVDGGTGSAGKLERISSAYFVNNEDDNISTTLSEGGNGARLYYDHNFYPDQARFSNVFSGDGGGFAYYGGDQMTWTAIYDQENTQYAIGDWRGINISQTKSDATGGQALYIDYNITNPAADFAFGQYIDVDTSGSAATGGDREQGGLRINFNSTTTGGSSTDEHRIYGIHVDSAISGDADMVAGIYTRALSNLSSGTHANLFGIDAYAEADNGTGTTITTAAGVRGNTYVDNAGSSIGNGYGGYFRMYQYSDGGSVTGAYGVYGELELNNTTAGNNYTTGYAFRAEIDNNTSRADAIGTSYLYYGNYSGTIPTNAYGLYILDSVPNYLSGNVRIGDLQSDHTTSSLSVYHATNSQMQFTNNTTGKADSNGFRVGHNGTQAQLYNFHNSDMGFATNNQQRMTIKDNGGVEIHGKAVLGTSTQTADGQNDIMLFATGIGGNAHSGNFHSKLRILGGGSQSRDLQLYQQDSEYAHIGSSWTNNQLTVNSDFLQVNINPKVYMNAGTKDTGGGNAVGNAALILQNGYLLIPGDETAIVFDEGQKMITVNDSQGNFHFKAGSDNDAIHVDSTSGTSGLCDINLDTDGTAGNINLAVGPRRSAGSTASLTAALNIKEGTNGLTWQTGSATSGTGVNSNVYKVWHEGNDGSGSGLDADTLDGVSWGNINTGIQTSGSIKAYNGTTQISTNGIYFESSNHCITWNDGRGNFNIRVGHDTSENVTETGYASHIEWSQSSGWMQLSGTTSSRSVGAGITWSNENVWQWTFSNGQFSSPGDVVAYSSDRRLKTNITNIDNALSKVLKLNGVYFDWADDIHQRGFHGAAPGEKAVGVIAQEVEAVLPELVAPAPFDVLTDEETGELLGSKSGEDYKTVKYEKLTALLIEAVKELSAKVDAQQVEINRLKGKGL